MFGPSWRKKFSAKYLFPTYDKPIEFICSQWQKEKTPSTPYFIYRLFIALTFFITWILSILSVGEKENGEDPNFSAKWLIYLTNWGYTTCTLQALIVLFMLGGCALAHHLNKKTWQKNVLKLYKVYWVTNTIGTSIAFGITVMYWSVIFDPKLMSFGVMNYFVHGNNTVLMFIDLWIVAHPVQIMHFFYPAIFGLCYAIFSVIYYAAGGLSRAGKVYIYPILNWDHPGSTILICLGVMFFTMALHIFAWCIYKLRTRLHNKFCEPLKDTAIDESMAYDNKAIANDLI